MEGREYTPYLDESVKEKHRQYQLEYGRRKRAMMKGLDPSQVASNSATSAPTSGEPTNAATRRSRSRGKQAGSSSRTFTILEPPTTRANTSMTHPSTSSMSDNQHVSSLAHQVQQHQQHLNSLSSCGVNQGLMPSAGGGNGGFYQLHDLSNSNQSSNAHTPEPSHLSSLQAHQQSSAAVLQQVLSNAQGGHNIQRHSSTSVPSSSSSATASRTNTNYHTLAAAHQMLPQFVNHTTAGSYAFPSHFPSQSNQFNFYQN